MQGDVFINNRKEQIPKENPSDNFFIQSESIMDTYGMQEPLRRINDYDNNILEDDAYKDIKDEIFKLEYKILRKEEDIRNLDREIAAAQDIKDYELVGTLQGRKLLIEEELVRLTKQYKESCLSAKISGGIYGKLKTKLDIIKSIILKIFGNFAKKIPGKLSYFSEIRDSINHLENINKSVDELVSMKIPYGESQEKYTQLSKYIVQANNIQTKISKLTKQP